MDNKIGKGNVRTSIKGNRIPDPEFQVKDYVTAAELGSLIRKVIHYHTLRGKFSSVHPELKDEGIVRVEVGEEGLRFVRGSGELLSFIS